MAQAEYDDMQQQKAQQQAQAQAQQQQQQQQDSQQQQQKSKQSSNQQNGKKMRTIGRWYIGETLGKGGYSWVKKGFDKKTGKCVALKFMAKADETWLQEQSKQVVTEIEALKQIRHQNVMKLYAYNLNAKYPTKNKERIDTILLVLEYAPGGELFDIMYYTSALESVVARTYFRQMMAGLEACHNAGVAHRDLKPQNLLLDSRFNLKITDFGLSKVFESDADAVMKTTYVGTRGYQAPELLLDQPYDLACDIFSAGVVLFILLTGYPPFEQAHTSDRWFKPLARNDFHKFWKNHRGCSIAKDEQAKDLLQKMLAFDPKERISIADIKKHAWYNDKFLQGKDLIRALRTRHREMESKRRKDARKVKDLQTSIGPPPTRDIDFGDVQEAPMFPEDQIESVMDTYTTCDWKQVYSQIDAVVGQAGGICTWDKDECKITCVVKVANADLQGGSHVKFEVQCYRSREYSNELIGTLDEEKEEEVYIVRMKRFEGTSINFNRIKRVIIFERCASVLTGLPSNAIRAKKLQRIKDQEMGIISDPLADFDDIDDEDDYDNVLAQDVNDELNQMPMINAQ